MLNFSSDHEQNNFGFCEIFFSASGQNCFPLVRRNILTKKIFQLKTCISYCSLSGIEQKNYNFCHKFSRCCNLYGHRKNLRNFFLPQRSLFETFSDNEPKTFGHWSKSFRFFVETSLACDQNYFLRFRRNLSRNIFLEKSLFSSFRDDEQKFLAFWGQFSEYVVFLTKTFSVGLSKLQSTCLLKQEENYMF